jgi:hypothetical protein
MKRAPFLGAGASLLLAGCGGGRSVLQMIPGIVSSGTRPSSKALQLVPQVADPIPDSVLKGPLMAEARRFDGAVAPSGWMLAQGQTLNIADNRQLFSILGTIAGGDGRLTFKLPNPGFGVILSVAGAFPTSPAFLTTTQTIRKITALASLGPGAQPSPPSMPKPPSQQVLAAQRLISSSIRVGQPHPQGVSRDLADRITGAKQDARSAAVAQLSPANQARLENAVQRAVAGQISVYGAVTMMTSTLSPSEASALLGINDGMIRAFNSTWAGSPRSNAQVNAAQFLISVAITPEQAHAIYARESNLTQ